MIKTSSVNHTNHPLTHGWHIKNTRHKKKGFKSYIKAKGAIKSTQRKKWNKKPTKGKRCVFLCIFDHWALDAQTVFSLRAAVVVLNMGRGRGVGRHNETKPLGTWASYCQGSLEENIDTDRKR